MPMPPSTVALPPMPTIIWRHPASSASRISWPVPYVVVSNGSRFLGGTRLKPEACAISMTAVGSPCRSNAWCSSSGFAARGVSAGR